MTARFINPQHFGWTGFKGSSLVPAMGANFTQPLGVAFFLVFAIQLALPRVFPFLDCRGRWARYVGWILIFSALRIQPDKDHSIFYITYWINIRYIMVFQYYITLQIPDKNAWLLFSQSYTSVTYDGIDFLPTVLPSTDWRTLSGRTADSSSAPQRDGFIAPALSAGASFFTSPPPACLIGWNERYCVSIRKTSITKPFVVMVQHSYSGENRIRIWGTSFFWRGTSINLCDLSLKISIE